MTKGQNKTAIGVAVVDEQEQSKEIIPAETNAVNFNAETLISQAIKNKVPVETMERLLAMRTAIKAEWAKEQFDKSMAKFQAECPVIEKTKKVSFGTTNYSYAPLEVIVKQVKELLSNNGFSYTFDTEESEKGLTIFCLVKHSDGHMEKSKCYIDIDNASKMNVSQKSGSAITYAKRYAFCNAFGILTGEEDTDARYQEESKDVVSDKKSFPASEKQLDTIKKMMEQKGITEAQVYDEGFDFKNLTGGYEGTASELITWLKQYSNYSTGLRPATDQDKIVHQFTRDLEECTTAQMYEKVRGEIAIAYENGNLTNSAYSGLVKTCKVIVQKFTSQN